MAEEGQVASVDDIAHDDQKLKEKAAQLVRGLGFRMMSLFG